MAVSIESLQAELLKERVTRVNALAKELKISEERKNTFDLSTPNGASLAIEFLTELKSQRENWFKEIGGNPPQDGVSFIDKPGQGGHPEPKATRFNRESVINSALQEPTVAMRESPEAFIIRGDFLRDPLRLNEGYKNHGGRLL